MMSQVHVRMLLPLGTTTEVTICDSGCDFVPYGGFTNNPVQVVFVENVKFMYFWLIASK